MTAPVEVPQGGYPVLGGPASGKVYALPPGRQVMEVAVVPPTTAYLAQEDPSPVALDIRTEVYDVQKFAWRWKGTWRYARVLVRFQDRPMAEGFLQALGGLWGTP